jgi:hypothetical protein
MSSNSVCPTFRKVLVASAFGACVFMIPNGVHSATSNSATLQWAANQETDLAGYRVYHGTTSGNYGGPQNVGMTPSYQYTNLEPNKTHYFSVTAYDTAGNESPPSPEVSKTIISELAEAAQLQEEQRLAEAAQLQEEQRLAEVAQLQEEQRLAEVAQLQEQQRLAKAAKLEQWKAAKAAKLEQWKAAKAAKLEQWKAAKAAQLQQQQQLAEAAQLQGPQQLAKAAKLEQWKAAKAAKLEQWKAAKAAQLEQWKAAKAAQLLAKIQRILAKIEQKLITYADNPKVMDQLNRQKVELLAKQDKIQENQPI